ncbi:MAG: hypothetical protein DDT19_02015 [Syntrophomonadaceae bacterium]|nr:hypothetical protein [Bacillota bacterium]
MVQYEIKRIAEGGEREDALNEMIHFLREGFNFLEIYDKDHNKNELDEFCKIGKTIMKGHYMEELSSDPETAKILAKAYKENDFWKFLRTAREFFEKNFAQEIDKKAKQSE